MTAANTTRNATRSTRITIAEPCCALVGSADFDGRDAEELAKGFAALADPVRLHLLSLVAGAGAAGACVCDLIAPSGRSQPTVSHHLKVLREAGLVTSEKRGTWAWYRVQDARVQQLRAALDTKAAT